MATKPTYYEQLKSPKWQKKRLEILQRDEFRCSCCGAEEFTLQVHHKYYEKNKSPWEYPDEALITLCVYCHSSEEFYKEMFTHTVHSICRLGVGYEDLWGAVSLLFFQSGGQQPEDVLAVFQNTNKEDQNGERPCFPFLFK